MKNVINRAITAEKPKSFFALLSVVFFAVTCTLLVSCEPMYNTGTYYYSYYLVNGTSSPIEVKWDKEYYGLNAGDTIVFHHYCFSEKGDNLFSLHRPTLEDGYEGQIDVQNCTVLYQNNLLKVDYSQTSSFLYKANYTGIQHPQSVFVYEYYFTIDEAYISSIPQ